MPYICLRRTDIPAGILQVLDLWPNTSLRNAAVDPPGQTKYVSFRPQNETVATGAGPNFTTSAAYYGIAAYLLDNIVAGGLAAGTGALTAAQANTIAANIVTGLNNAHPMTEADLDTYLSATVAATGFATGGSTMSAAYGAGITYAVGQIVFQAGASYMCRAVTVGNAPPNETYWTPIPNGYTVKEFLSILTGERYLLGAAKNMEDGAGNKTLRQGAFVTPSRIRRTYNGLPIEASVNEGKLSYLKSPTFEYLDVTGAAVVVYSDTGAVL